MPVSVTMPRLGESVTEGTVTRWLKQEGDRVEADEPLLEVSTDKVDTEIPSPAAGVLSRIVVQEDETAEVGSELALIDGDEAGGSDQAESGSAGTTAEDTAAAPAAPDQEPEPVAQPEPVAEPEPAAEPEPSAASAEPEPEPAAPAATATEQDGGTTVLRMPALGESVTEGTVTRWLKAVGDTVDADEPLLEVSTDKVDTEIPSPVAGTLLEIRVAEDEVAEVGGELAVIGAAGQQPAAAQPATDRPAASESTAPEPTAPEASASDSSDVPSSGAAPGTERAAASLPGASYATPDAEAETGNGAGSSQTGVATAQPSEHAPVEAGEGVSVRADAKPEPQQPQSEGASQPQRTAAAADGDDAGGGYVTPLVRKLAAQHDVDLAGLSGTGVGGRIRKQDVLEAAERQRAAAQAAKEAEAARAAQAQAQPAGAPSGQPAAAKAPAKAQPSPLRGRTEKMSRMRTLIARRMVESLQISAQLTTVVEVDVTRIARLRDQAKGDFLATHGVKLSFLPFFTLAAIEALRVHPNVNASVDMEAGTVTYHNAEHLGIAVDSERGLLVPVIHDAGDLNLAGLAKRIADLAERTRGNKVTPDELSGGTFTLTNTGSRGALFDTPIINQPQVAILGTGAVVKRAVVVNDPNLGEVIVPRSMVYLALSYDHRIVDGADAVRFLGTIKERLEAGQFEAELGLT